MDAVNVHQVRLRMDRSLVKTFLCKSNNTFQIITKKITWASSKIWPEKKKVLHTKNEDCPRRSSHEKKGTPHLKKHDLRTVRLHCRESNTC